MNTLMNILMLSCTKATRLIEKKSFDGLSTAETIRLSMHTTMCNACKQYQKQSNLLNDAISIQLNSFTGNFPENHLHLQSEIRHRIQEEIEKNLGKK